MEGFWILLLSLSKEFVHLTLKDVIVGVIITKCPLLNYLLLIAKIYLWECRRTQIVPNITGFKLKVKNKFETEKYVCMKNNTLDKFNKSKNTYGQTRGIINS